MPEAPPDDAVPSDPEEPLGAPDGDPDGEPDGEPEGDPVGDPVGEPVGLPGMLVGPGVPGMGILALGTPGIPVLVETEDTQADNSKTAPMPPHTATKISLLDFIIGTSLYRHSKDEFYFFRGSQLSF